MTGSVSGYGRILYKGLAGLVIAVLLAPASPATGAGAAGPLPAGAAAAAGGNHCLHSGAKVSINHLQSPPICVTLGARLSVQFNKRGQGIGTPGPWAKPPLSTSTSSVLGVVSTKTAGRFLFARVRAKAVGTVTLNAYFNQECSGPQTTACTIPPEASFTVSLRVVS